MQFTIALGLVTALVLFVLVCTMSNLYVRLSHLERASAIGPMRESVGEPASLPPELVASLGHDGNVIVVFVSNGCVACERALRRMASWHPDVRERTFVEFLDGVPTDFVAPDRTRLARSDWMLSRQLPVPTRPFMVALSGGRVSGVSSDFAQPPTPINLDARIPQ